MTSFSFESIGVVGVGLIGGSVALASRRARSSVRIVGCDEPRIAADARDARVIDVAGDISDLCECDLIVLAAPVSSNLAWLDRLAAAGAPGIVTDVGGTKRQMHAKAAGLPGLRFVGGHPMAGSERSGFHAADAALFSGRRWFIVPGPSSAPADLAAVEHWVASLGAQPTVTEADLHDRVMASVSALPQVTASALMAVVGDRVDRDGLGMAGPALRDTTRLASSAATWMTDGLAHNARDVADAIDALIAELRVVRDQLDTPERAASMFTRAQQWRRTLLDIQQ